MFLVIVSFADRETERLYVSGKSKRFPATVISVALRKLDYLNRAKSLHDLLAPPGNRLEALKGDLKGRHSVRINDQCRIVFKFHNGDAYEVEVTDYH
jgi:proteic killer suppression protein